MPQTFACYVIIVVIVWLAIVFLFVIFEMLGCASPGSHHTRLFHLCLYLVFFAVFVCAIFVYAV